MSNRYVALIRAINVGGHSLLQMRDLKTIFESFGASDVTTHLHSGNVLFSTQSTCPDELSRDFSRKLSKIVGQHHEVFVFSKSDLKEAALLNPFNKNALDMRCHIMFLSAEPSSDRIQKLMELQGKEYSFYVQDKTVYYTYPKEYDGSRRTINFEKVLGTTGTSRTCGVIDKLIQLMQ